jgi:hypothetical protein
MAAINNQITASVDVLQKENTVGLVLELPHDFMRLAVSANGEDSSDLQETEHTVVIECIRNINYVRAAIQRLNKQKWALLQRTLDRLRSLPQTLQLLTALLDIQGLWAAINVIRLQFLVDMATRYEDAVNRYLNTMFTRWTLILAPLGHLNMVTDSKSVEALAGLWPHSNLRDRQQVEKLLSQKDFFPQVKDVQSRAALSEALTLLDGRILTFEILLGEELRLLKQAARCVPSAKMKRMDESQSFDPQYWNEWAGRFVTLCGKANSFHKGKKAACSGSRNVYQSKEVFFTSCRWCNDTTQHRGIWRFQGDLAPFFATPATQSPDLPDARNLPLQGLVYDFLRCFFGNS